MWKNQKNSNFENSNNVQCGGIKKFAIWKTQKIGNLENFKNFQF